MIVLSEEEKANRYDALQTAIKYTLDRYKKEKKSADSEYDSNRIEIFGAFHKGRAAAYEEIISDLKRWSNGL